MKKAFAFVALAALTATAAAADSGRAPLMGWSSWNTYFLDINDQLIREQADAMVSTGLKDAGYQFINIDDGYWNGRAADGTLIIDTKKFPNGMRAVADYIHSKGLKAGIYSDAGDNTCGSGNKAPYGLNVGLYGHEEADCRTYFKDWDYDFIKVDYCGGMHLGIDEKEQYTKIAEAIKNCGKDDIHYNICRWALPGTWAADIADSWRTTGDITNKWESVRAILGENLYLSAYCRDGHYNDMDMLEVGRGMTPDEDLTHFAMWCIMDSPLLVGCDMRNMSPSTIELLTNKELIALNQDPLHLQAYVGDRIGDTYVMVKDIDKRLGKTRAIAVYNPSDKAQTVNLDLPKLELGGKVALRDLVSHKDLGKAEDRYTVTVPAHGVRVFKAKADKRLVRTRYEAETGFIPAYQEIRNNQTENTGVYSEGSSAYSGGAAVRWLGHRKDNCLIFNDVYSSKGGAYKLTIAYLSAEDRNIAVDVNGRQVANLKCNSGDYVSKVATQSVTVNLNKGMNTITLSNPTYFMPDIDYIDVEPIASK